MSYQVPERRKEWVEDLRGGRLCVWELDFESASRLARLSTKPNVAGGGIDAEEAMLWKIALSCYQDDAEGAKRVFADGQVHLIRRLPEGELDRITQAMNSVNQEGAAEEQRLRDFISAPAANGSPSASGVCVTSTGSPAS